MKARLKVFDHTEWFQHCSPALSPASARRAQPAPRTQQDRIVLWSASELDPGFRTIG